MIKKLPPEYHEEFGKVSGIPPCCRNWFHVWLRVADDYYDYDEDPFNYLPSYVRYVPCPGCRHTQSFISIISTQPEIRITILKKLGISWGAASYGFIK